MHTVAHYDKYTFDVRGIHALLINPRLVHTVVSKLTYIRLAVCNPDAFGGNLEFH